MTFYQQKLSAGTETDVFIDVGVRNIAQLSDFHQPCFVPFTACNYLFFLFLNLVVTVAFLLTGIKNTSQSIYRLRNEHFLILTKMKNGIFLSSFSYSTYACSFVLSCFPN